MQENYENEKETAEQKAEESIPSWIERGEALIYPERYEEWEQCVQTSATGLYHGMLLDTALEIMEALDEGASMEEAKEILNSQGHSNGSAGRVRNIILSFSSKGPDFWEATAIGEISPEEKQMLEAKREENQQIEEAHAKSGKLAK